MNVLSLFDGKSSGYTACELAGIEIGTYYSAEVDKYAIKVSDAIHPDQIRLGDVTKWREWDIDWSSIDMIFGGFPCQAWSMAGKQMGDKDERGMLFWTMLDIMKHVRHHNPKSGFLIENVKMKKEFEEYITFHMNNAVGDVHKILINSALVSAQNRNRYYWTSFEVTQPEDRGIVLADVIEHSDDIQGEGWSVWWEKNKDYQLKKQYSAICNDGSRDKAITMTARQFASWNGNFVEVESSSYTERCKKQILKNGKTPDRKAVAVCTNSNLTGSGVNAITFDKKHYRKLTPRECFRLQTVPEHYIDKILNCGVSNTQLYKIAGNGWTDEVIAHVLKCYKRDNAHRCK